MFYPALYNMIRENLPELASRRQEDGVFERRSARLSRGEYFPLMQITLLTILKNDIHLTITKIQS